MSQFTFFSGSSNPSMADIETISGNSGGPAGPDGAGNFDLLGDNATGLDFVTNPGTNSGTMFGLPSSTTQVGTTAFATGAETIAGVIDTKAVTPLGLASKLGTQTQNGLAYGNTTAGAIQWLGEAADGQLPIGQTGGAPVLANITSLDGSVNVTNGPGSIDLSVGGQVTGTGQTIGAVTDDVITLALGATPGTYTLESRISGFESTNPASAGFQVFATVRTDGATATLVGIPDIVSNLDTPIDSALADVVVSGNDAIIRVTGVAAVTINWRADLQYTFIG